MTQAATKLGTSFDGVLLLMNSIIRLAFMVVAVCVILGELLYPCANTMSEIEDSARLEAGIGR